MRHSCVLAEEHGDPRLLDERELVALLVQVVDAVAHEAQMREDHTLACADGIDLVYLVAVIFFVVATDGSLATAEHAHELCTLVFHGYLVLLVGRLQMIIITLHDLHDSRRHFIGKQWARLLQISRQVQFNAFSGSLLKSR